MSYVPSPSASGDTLSASRDVIRTNFNILQDRFDENHVNLDGGAGGGKHNFLQMPDQGTIPVTASGEGGVYGTSDGDAVSQLYFRGEGNGSSYQLTKATSGVDANILLFGTNTPYVADHAGGWTFLPGGLILQYGRKTTPTASGTVTFPLAFPSGNNPFSIIVTNERTSARSANIDSSAISDTSFDYFMETAGAVAINWIAIGN